MTDILDMHPRVFPIPIREDCVVRIFGLPHDLTKAEAEKIGRIIIAMARLTTEGDT